MAVVVLSVPVAPATAAPASRPVYVALGDSYTAGPLIPRQLPGPKGCLRSTRNYPHRVAAGLGATLRDLSCSGATTTDLRAPQAVAGGFNRPQLDALDRSTSVVTLGIGGNDIGFAGILTACLSPTPLGRPCQDRFAPGGADVLAGRIAAASTTVASVLAEIGRRAPDARVFVVGYPSILPDDGPGCWPVMPVAVADAAYLRQTAKALNTMLASRAADAGAVYVDTYRPSLGHDACALPAARWIEPVVPAARAAPVHPNARGMTGIAAAVLAAAGAPYVALSDGCASVLLVPIGRCPGR